MSEALAIYGGSPVRTKPWLDNFTTGEAEIAAVTEVLKSGYLSLFEGSHTPASPFRFDGGPWVRRLEKAMSDRLGGSLVVSVNSATSGLYAAIGALGIGFGDEVICSPYTMSACAIAPIIYGAIPVFADVEIETGCLSVESIEREITPRTKAILLVHQFGIPADMDGIMELAERYGLRVIEDCAQAWGASHRGRPVGTIGDIGIFSFNVNKTIQAGEGGLCVTRDEELDYRLKLIRNHGEAVVGSAGYDQITNMIGFNYRLTEVQAAIAIEQLNKLDMLNKCRLELVEQFIDGLAPFDEFKVLRPRRDTTATYYIVPFRYIPERFADVPRENVVEAINAEGILHYPGYVQPLYLQPVYQQRHAYKNGYPWAAPENRDSRPNYDKGQSPNAEKLHFRELIVNEHIRLPHTKDDITNIIKAMGKVHKGLKK